MQKVLVKSSINSLIREGKRGSKVRTVSLCV